MWLGEGGEGACYLTPFKKPIIKATYCVGVLLRGREGFRIFL